MNRKFRFATICLVSILLSFCNLAQATLVGISWKANLNVLPGMEDELPNGVINGQEAYGRFLYETDWHWVSGGNDRRSNYRIYSWYMNLGNDNTFSRRYDDGLSGLGQGGLAIYNAYHDILCFDVSISSSYNVNEYFFRLILEDFHGSVWRNTDQPESFNFEKFENVCLEIWRIKLGVPGSAVTIARMNGLDETNLVQIPEPGSLLLFAGAFLAFLNKRHISL